MDDLIKKYIEWLNNKYIVRHIGEWYEITTPFLNQHNDYIQIFAQNGENGICLSDDGITIDELELSGVKIDRSEKRKAELFQILNNFGISKNEGNELYINCAEKDFPESKHRFIQALLAVYDMYLLSDVRVESFFFEDVKYYFDEKDIRYTPNVNFIGRSNFSHQFDFSIPKSKKYSERIIKLLNNSRKDLVLSSLFSFEDTQKNRPESRGIIIINDKINKNLEAIGEAATKYGILAIPFSKIDDYFDALAA